MQAKKPGDSQILQFIPRSKLIDDFPACLIDQYVHWLDRSTRELEFRPVGSTWTPEASNWRLYINEPDIHPRAILRRPSQGSSSTQVIDIRSGTFGVVSSLLSPLESPLPPRRWKFPSLGFVYRSLSTRTGSSSVGACPVMLLTRHRRVGRCLA